MVVLPDDSGPKISMIRPRGTPPTPSAASTPIEPVEIALMGTNSFAPRRMIEPLPNWRSICDRAVSAAFSLSFGTVAIYLLLHIPFSQGGLRGEEREKVDPTSHRVVQRV